MDHLTEAQSRALRGGMWLTLMAPGWRAAIDWDRLDIDSLRECVAGQVFAGCTTGPCWNGYEHLWLCLGLGLEHRRHLGFTGWLADGIGADELGQAWRDMWQPA